LSSFPLTPRNQVHRLPKRASYDRDQIYGILDQTFLCHAGFQVEGQVYVIPTIYGRREDTIYMHGSAASRMLKELAKGFDACVTVTLLDGMVLARSAFHHSVNYRSVVLFGQARALTDPGEKSAALEIITEQVAPGRWAEVRGPNEKELKATSVLAMPIDSASAKVRTGGPIDDEEDYTLPVWAGVVPVRMAAGTPADDGRVLPGVGLPASLSRARFL